MIICFPVNELGCMKSEGVGISFRPLRRASLTMRTAALARLGQD